MKFRRITAALLSTAALAALPVAPFAQEAMQSTAIIAAAANEVTVGNVRYDIVSQNGDKYAVAVGAVSGATSVSVSPTVSGNGSYNVPVRKIGDYAFAGLSGLKSISLSNARYLTEIGTYAFGSCAPSNGITIPSGVTKIGAYAFYEAKLATNFNIGSDATDIDVQAFVKARNVRSFSVASANTALKSVDGVLYSKNGSILYCYPQMKTNSSFTTNASKIPDGAIDGNTYLKTLSISNLYRGGSEIVRFAGLENLENLTIPQVDYNQSPGTILNRYQLLFNSTKLHKLNGQEIVVVPTNGKPYFNYKFSTYMKNNFEKYTAFNSILKRYNEAMADYVINLVTKPQMDDLTKARKLHDWILQNTTYDPRVSYANNLKREHIVAIICIIVHNLTLLEVRKTLHLELAIPYPGNLRNNKPKLSISLT